MDELDHFSLVLGLLLIPVRDEMALEKA